MQGPRGAHPRVRDISPSVPVANDARALSGAGKAVEGADVASVRNFTARRPVLIIPAAARDRGYNVPQVAQQLGLAQPTPPQYRLLSFEPRPLSSRRLVHRVRALESVLSRYVSPMLPCRHVLLAN